MEQKIEKNRKNCKDKKYNRKIMDKYVLSAYTMDDITLTDILRKYQREMQRLNRITKIKTILDVKHKNDKNDENITRNVSNTNTKLDIF